MRKSNKDMCLNVVLNK